MVEKAIAALAEVQRALVALHREAAVEYDRGPETFEYPDYISRLFVADIGRKLAVEYYGENYETIWVAVQAVLASPAVAPHLALLRLSGPDEGANGMREWSFKELIKLAPSFPALTEFYIRPTEAADHNLSIVEDDQLARILAMMPNVRRLTLPHAPEPAVFGQPLAGLNYLRIGMEHRTRGFIEHLAQGRSMANLVTLDFSDSLGPWLNIEPQPAEWTSTPFAHYQRLLASPAVPKLKILHLRNAILTEEQYKALQTLRPGLNFGAIINPPLAYVSHWGNTHFPYRHLLARP